MYLRFVVYGLDDDSGRREGLFQAAVRLRDSNSLPALDQAALVESLRWFNVHLASPPEKLREKRATLAPHAIGWFKDSATECIRLMRVICRILDDAGIATTVLTTSKPGYIVFEDEQQIAAIPFADTAT